MTPYQIKEDPKSKLFDPSKSVGPAEIKNMVNCSYTNVSFSHIVGLLSNYHSSEESKDLISTLCAFIEANKITLAEWSFVMVNRVGGKNGDVKIQGEFYRNGKLENEPIKFIDRGTFKEMNDGSTLKLSSLQDRQKDQLFDVIDCEESVMEYEKSQTKAKVVQNYRNKKGKPIMIVYLVRATYSKTEPILELPMYSVSIPDWNGQINKITYISRKKYN